MDKVILLNLSFSHDLLLLYQQRLLQHKFCRQLLASHHLFLIHQLLHDSIEEKLSLASHSSFHRGLNSNRVVPCPFSIISVWWFYDRQYLRGFYLFALLLRVGNDGLRVGLFEDERALVHHFFLPRSSLPEHVKLENDVFVVRSDHWSVLPLRDRLKTHWVRKNAVLYFWGFKLYSLQLRSYISLSLSKCFGTYRERFSYFLHNLFLLYRL